MNNMKRYNGVSCGMRGVNISNNGAEIININQWHVKTSAYQLNVASALV